MAFGGDSGSLTIQSFIAAGVFKPNRKFDGIYLAREQGGMLASSPSPGAQGGHQAIAASKQPFYEGPRLNGHEIGAVVA
jgi:hypothetical protein